jgi:aspartate kinase
MSLVDCARLLVVKFGGTSLASPARVRRAAARLARLEREGYRVVSVVSAAAGTTDRILGWHADVSGEGRLDREADRALATGELLSAALLSAALGAKGLRSRSFTGREAGIIAEGPHGAGRLERLDPEPLNSALATGTIPVVAGFQAGLAGTGETVTLGRGASDLTAVFLAAHLGAPECHIVTDVDGVYSSDPRRGGRGAKFRRLSHERLCQLARDGARVVQVEAAELAHAHGISLRIYHYRAPHDRPGGTTVADSPESDTIAVSA